MIDNLWGNDFIQTTNTSEIVNKLKQKPKKVGVVDKSLPRKLQRKAQIEEIEKEVNNILGKFKENTRVIRDYSSFKSYIDFAISVGEIAVDTETNNSLDTISCKLMGLCLYVPGEKQAYIPVNHIDANGLLDNQLTEEQIKEQLDRLSSTKIIMHNAKFDYQVIKCTCDCKLSVYWDTMIGAKILNENEEAKLKTQYINKIDPSIEKYDIEHLFQHLPYEIFSPELFALYAATDAYMTYRLYNYQKEIFEKEENKKLYSLFLNIEMPIVEVTSEMELNGVCIDEERAKRLSDKWHKKLENVEKRISEELDKYKDVIAQWRLTDEANKKPKSGRTTKSGEEHTLKSKSEQLKDPVEVTSPTQVAILLYDVLKCPIVDKETPRGTGDDILKKLNYPICKLILEKRGIEKLLDTYIDKLPSCVNKKTGRLHANFNQLGAKTGRFSSSDPNLQNIPSQVNTIRNIFVPSVGSVLVGADFS